MLASIVFRGLGRKEEAERYGRLGLKRAEEALRAHPESSRPAHLGACVLAGLGENERATEWLEHALAIDPDDNNTRYNAACTYAQMGQIDRAIDMLEIWANHAGADHIMWFRHDADLDPVRCHPRYAGLVSRLEEVSTPATV